MKQRRKDELAKADWIVEKFAQLNPSDNLFSIEERTSALERAGEAAQLEGILDGAGLDRLYTYYRIEMDLLVATSNRKPS